MREPIEPSPATVERGILEGDHPGRPVTQFGRQVPCPGRGVTVIRCHVPRHRPVQDLIDLGVPLVTALVPLVGDGVR